MMTLTLQHIGRRLAWGLGLATLCFTPVVMAQQVSNPLEGWQEGRQSNNDLGSLLNGGGQGGNFSLPSLMNQIRNMDARSYSEVAEEQRENIASEAANFRQRQLELHNQNPVTPAP